jgi:hypothetical protein
MRDARDARSNGHGADPEVPGGRSELLGAQLQIALSCATESSES